MNNHIFLLTLLFGGGKGGGGHPRPVSRGMHIDTYRYIPQLMSEDVMSQVYVSKQK